MRFFPFKFNTDAFKRNIYYKKYMLISYKYILD